MTHKPHIISDEKYEGPSKTTVALGKAKVYGYVGTASGMLGFGTLSAMSPKFSEFIANAAGAVKDGVESAKRFVLGEKAAANTHLGVIVGTALAGGFIFHWIGIAFGLRKGLEKAQLGEEQFEKIKQERNDAEDALKGLKEQINTLDTKANPEKKHTDLVQSRDASYTHAALTDKETAAEITR